MARPRPAPRADRRLRRSGRAGGLPRQATSKTRARSSSGMPPHASVTLSSTPSSTGRPRDLDDAVGGRVPDRVDDQVGHHPGQPARVGRHRRARRRRCPPSRTPRGAGDRVGAGDRLADHVAERDRLRGSAAARRRGSATARRGRRPSAPSGRPRRGSGGGSAPGRRPCRPRAPRSSPAARPAACAGRGRPTTTSSRRDSSSRCSRAGTPAAAALVAASSVAELLELGRARGAPATNRPLSPNRRASSRSARDQRANAAPTASATTSGDHPGDDARPRAPPRSRGRRGTSPGRCRRRRPPPRADGRRATTSASCHRNDRAPDGARRRPARRRPTPSRPGAGRSAMIWHAGQRAHAAASQR